MFKRVNTGVIAITKEFSDKDRSLWEEFQEAGIDMTVIPVDEIKDIVAEHQFRAPTYLIFNKGDLVAWSPNKITVEQFRKAIRVSV